MTKLFGEKCTLTTFNSPGAEVFHKYFCKTVKILVELRVRGRGAGKAQNN